MTPPSSVRRARVLSFVLALWLSSGSLLFMAPAVPAPPTGLNVNPGLYSHPGLPRHPYVYVPDETISFTIVGDPGFTETLDAAVVVLPPTRPGCTPGQPGCILQGYQNVVVPQGGSVTLTYQVPPALADGPDYAIEVGDSQYIDFDRCCTLFRRQRFAVQAYELKVEVDRPAYIGGDEVIVTWSANNLKDGSLAPDGFGQLWVFDTNGRNLLPTSPFQYQKASGNTRFTLNNLADPQFDAIVETWFNNTPVNQERFQQAAWFFGIDSLGVFVDVTPNQYPPGGIVSTNIRTVVTDNQVNPSPFDPPEPNINVDISVWEVTPTGTVQRPQYGTTGLVSDAHGELTYLFKLADTVADGTDFEVRADASHANRVQTAPEKKDTFTVSAAAGLTQHLQFNQNEYQAGDTATVTSIVSGAGSTPLTFIFEVRDTTTDVCTPAFAAGALLATDTRTLNTFSYAIPQNFDGQICFRVTADDGKGNRATNAQRFDVLFGWVLVNADRREYNAGETVTITWDLRSNKITTPTYFYEVRDVDGNLVTSNTTGTVRRFTFRVPALASVQYTFRVTATQSGRAVSGSVTLAEVTGFFITATFDRPSYLPGDTMHIRYTIAARSSNLALPSTFTITYGLENGPAGGSFQVVSTASRSGELTYRIPKGIDEGNQIFLIREANTNTQAFEVVAIRATSPLGETVFASPIISLVLLLLIIVVFLVLWRGGLLPGLPKRAPGEVPPAPTKPEPVHAPMTSPMSVTCRSCGSPIEITTSKRPIEVMCPKCGNTEMVA